MYRTMKIFACGAVAACALAAPAFAQNRGLISWSGQVDDTVIVRIHHDRVRTITMHGAAPTNVNSNVQDPLPMAPVHVWLSDVHGRGRVRIIEEPNFSNNYTAVIRVKDPQNGTGYYAFNLRWRDDNASGNTDNDNDNDDNR